MRLFVGLAALFLGLGVVFGLFVFRPQRAVVHRAAVPAGPDRRDGPQAAEPAEEHARLLSLQRELAAEKARDRDLTAQVETLRKRRPVTTSLLRDLENASTPELIDMVNAIGAAGSKRLLTVPEPVRIRYASLLAMPGTGVARILPRGKYAKIIFERGGGAYYSFATKSNSYDKQPDLQLEQDFYSTSFYGGTYGFLLDLGELAVARVPEGPDSLPSTLEEKQREAWALMWEDAPDDKTDGPVASRGQQRRAGYAFRNRAFKLGLRNRLKAQDAHTYLLRAVLPHEHDILVAFRPASRAEDGDTLVWRILKRWQVFPRN